MKLLPTLVSLTVLVSTGLSNPQLVVPQVVGFNKVMNARNLYVFSKVGWGASLGTNGMGVYACSKSNWQGTCNWFPVIGNNSFKSQVGHCTQFFGANIPVGSIGPDPGIYCAIFHGEDTCRWYSGEPPQTVVPPSTELTVALKYPGISNLSGNGFGADLHGVWGYCFRGDSAFNPCTLVWGPSC